MWHFVFRWLSHRISIEQNFIAKKRRFWDGIPFQNSATSLAAWNFCKAQMCNREDLKSNEAWYWLLTTHETHWTIALEGLLERWTSGLYVAVLLIVSFSTWLVEHQEMLQRASSNTALIRLGYVLVTQIICCIGRAYYYMYTKFHHLLLDSWWVANNRNSANVWRVWYFRITFVLVI